MSVKMGVDRPPGVAILATGLKVLPDEMTDTLFSEIAREPVPNGGTHDQESARITPREREVIELVAEGLSNKAISRDQTVTRRVPPPRWTHHPAAHRANRIPTRR